MSVEVVSVGVEVPNPGGGFGTFRKGTVEVSGLSEQLEGRRVVDLDEFALASAPCLLYTSPSPRDVEESRMPSSA